LRPTNHALLATATGAAIWALSGELLAVPLTFAAGVLVDADHLPDQSGHVVSSFCTPGNGSLPCRLPRCFFRFRGGRWQSPSVTRLTSSQTIISTCRTGGDILWHTGHIIASLSSESRLTGELKTLCKPCCENSGSGRIMGTIHKPFRLMSRTD